MENNVKYFFRNQTIVKIISFFLTLLIIFFAVPSIIYAEALEALKADKSDEPSSIFFGSEEEASGELNIYEVKELREENVKHFRLEDGTFIAAVYPTAVHTLDENGNWEDINNKLLAASNEITTSDQRIKFAKKTTGNGNLFTINSKNTKLTFNLIGAKKGIVGEVRNHNDAEEETELQKMMNLENLLSSVIYRDILTNVDIEYILNGSSIKENIIIKEKTNEYSYAFELDLNGLSATLEEDGSVSIFDSYNNIVSMIPAPIIYDANGAFGFANYSLSKQNATGKYILTASADTAWMNDEERSFPVTLDPAICAPNYTITSLSVNSSAPTQNYASSSYIYVYTNGIGYWKTNSLDFIPKGSYISNATLRVCAYTASSGYVSTHMVTSQWDSTLTYEKTQLATPQGAISDNIISYTYANGAKDSFFNFDITEAVRNWYDYSSENYGIAFKYMQGGRSYFYTSNNATPANRPCLSVSYVSQRGIESYNSYSSHVAGTVASGSVNLATGGLVMSIPLLTATNGILPYTVSLAYDSALANNSLSISNSNVPYLFSMASYGFKWSMQQSVVKSTYCDENGTPKDMYIWSDADGTEHSFFESSTDGEYIDNGGLGFTLYETNSEINIVTKDRTSYTFSEFGTVDAWYLSSISDKNSNRIVFTYDTMTLRPLSVKFAPGQNASDEFEIFRFVYSSEYSVTPKAVYDVLIGKGIVFSYSDTYNGSNSTDAYRYLTSIDFVTGSPSWTDSEWASFTTGDTIASLKFAYLSSGLIESVRDDVSDSGVVYNYSGSKVISITESNTQQNGQKISYNYGIGYTDVRTSGADDIHGNDDDIVTRSVFDSYGRAISVYSKKHYGSQIYNGTIGEYETQENSKNSLKEVLEVKDGSVNYLVNGGFEDGDDGFRHWTKSSGVTSDLHYSKEPYTTGGAKLTVSPSKEESLSQIIRLLPGTYTLSLDMTNIFASGTEIWLRIINLSNTSDVQSFQLPKNDYYNDYNLSEATKRLAQSFTVTQTQNYKIEIAVLGRSNTSSVEYYLDNVMLTSGENEAAYNMVDLGGFETYSKDSSQNTIDISQYWTLPTSAVLSAPYPTLSGNALFFECNSITETKEAIQRIYQPAYHSYFSYFDREFIVSGYAKSENAIIGENAKFAIRVDVKYKNQELQSFDFNFNPSCKDFQFVTGKFTIEAYYEIEYIDISCVFSGQHQASVFFDNISVIDATDYNSVEYEYYENGNLKSSSNSYASTIYIYDEDEPDLLTIKADSTGVLYEYEYDANGNLTKETVSDFYITEHGSSGIVSVYVLLDTSNIDSIITKSIILETKYTVNVYGLVTEVRTTSSANENEIMITSYTYETSSYNRAFFGCLKSSADHLGNVTYYSTSIQASLGIISSSVDDESGSGVAIISDVWGNVLKVLPAINGTSSDITLEANTESVIYGYNSKNELNTITTASTVYRFTYDSYGNPLTISAGDNTLAYYSYNSNNGKLNKVTYGNGFFIEYIYNDLENVSEIWYTENGSSVLAYRYLYTESGLLHSVEDVRNGKTNVYNYDKSGKITLTSEYSTEDMSNALSVGYTYDDEGNVSSVKYKFAYKAGEAFRDSYFYTNYYYQGDLQSLSRETLSLQSSSGYNYANTYYTYDKFGRTINTRVSYGSAFTINTDYTFDSIAYGADTATSSRVKAYTVSVNGASTEYSYTYDARGNIRTVSIAGVQQYRYQYDNLGQLIREDNIQKNQTYVYEYDYSGNITAKKIYPLVDEFDFPSGSGYTEISYSYSTGEWGDLLTSFNGSGITYDSIGNPLTYYGNRVFTWEGRRLVEALVDSNTISFEYNDSGLRTSKTVNGVTTNYYFVDSTLMAEETNGNVTLYMYNSTGIIGFRYRASSYAQNVWDTYLYEKNLQGDIVAVYDSNGVKKISYTYDAWGNFTATYHNGASESTLNNPFTYRGYYYDKDLALYYLASRYYDSNTGRFINVDGQLNTSTIFGYNLFAYCENNPVVRIDPNGDFFLMAMAATVAGAFAAAAGAVAIVASVGLAVNVAVNVGEIISEAIIQITNNLEEDETPKSITNPDNNDNADDENKTSLPTEGEPNSDMELYDKKGLKQRRHYGPDGKAEYDIDFRHSGEKHIFPHKHYWNWTKKIPRGPAVDNIKIF